MLKNVRESAENVVLFSRMQQAIGTKYRVLETSIYLFFQYSHSQIPYR